MRWRMWTISHAIFCSEIETEGAVPPPRSDCASHKKGVNRFSAMEICVLA